MDTCIVIVIIFLIMQASLSSLYLLKKFFFISGIPDKQNMSEHFLQHVLKSCCEFQVKADRTLTDEFQYMIRSVIHDIIKRIEETGPEFKVSDIIPTGSS